MHESYAHAHIHMHPCTHARKHPGACTQAHAPRHMHLLLQKGARVEWKLLLETYGNDCVGVGGGEAQPSPPVCEVRSQALDASSDASA